MARSESRNRIRIAALLFLVVAGYYWKLTLTRQFEWMTGNDLAEQVPRPDGRPPSESAFMETGSVIP